jgi:hypothetical protein
MLSHPPLPSPPPACLRGLPPSPTGLPVAVSLDAGCALVVLERRGRVVWRSQRTFHPGHHRRVFTTISAT